MLCWLAVMGLTAKASVFPEVDDYARGVLSGEIIACKLVKLAAERHFRWKERDDIFFDAKAAKMRCDFFPAFLKHYKGAMAGKPLELSPWQKFFFGSVYGWKRKATGYRVIQYAYLEVPRKNGKTTSAAGPVVQELFIGGEGGAEIYAVATKEDQAKILWKDVRAMIKKSPDLLAEAKIRVREIEYEEMEAVFRALGSDSDTLDGLNPHLWVCDELHAWKYRELWDVMDDATGARMQPINLMITTAGSSQLGICYTLRTHLVNILEQVVEDSDEWFGLVYTVDDPEKWQDETEWYKANPNLGVSKTLDYMRKQARMALQMPTKLNAFLNKQLNIWTDAAQAWVTTEVWRKNGSLIDVEALRGKRCYMGIDLAEVRDLSALVLLFPPQEGVPVLTALLRCWIPEEDIEKRSKMDRVPYKVWRKQGLIEATPGNVTDFDFIEAAILKEATLYDVVEVAYDPWKATQTAIHLQDAGLEMVPVRQGYKTLSPPINELERLLTKAAFNHGGNPVFAWAASNVVAVYDPTNAVKFDKAKSRERIDPMAALINALARYMEEEADEQPQIFV